MVRDKDSAVSAGGMVPLVRTIARDAATVIKDEVRSNLSSIQRMLPWNSNCPVDVTSVYFIQL